jgi:hypothetical protein
MVFPALCHVWFLLAVVLMKLVTAYALRELGRENCRHCLHTVLSKRQSGRLNHIFISCSYIQHANV